MFMVKFSATAINFGYDFVLIVHFYYFYYYYIAGLTCSLLEGWTRDGRPGSSATWLQWAFIIFYLFFLLHVLFFLFQNLFPPKGDPGYPCPCGSHRGAHHDGCSSWDGLHQLLVTNQRWRNQRNPRASKWKTTKQDQTTPKKPRASKLKKTNQSYIWEWHFVTNCLKSWYCECVGTL